MRFGPSAVSNLISEGLANEVWAVSKLISEGLASILISEGLANEVRVAPRPNGLEVRSDALL